jgi:acetone carboxylase gamma subunit
MKTLEEKFPPLDTSNDPIWPFFAGSRCPACGAKPGEPHNDPWCPVIRKPEKPIQSYAG